MGFFTSVRMDINWKLCIACQKETSEDVKCPPGAKGSITKGSK